jgi:hypothetical protein
MARRITRAFITGRPSSEIATAPACTIDPIAASSSPALPLGDRADREYVNDGVTTRFLDDVAGDGGVVVHRRRIRHRTNRRESTRGRGARPALDGFRVLESRLAQVHMHVDETRRDDQSRRVKLLCA